jgi:hypothetical protein
MKSVLAITSLSLIVAVADLGWTGKFAEPVQLVVLGLVLLVSSGLLAGFLRRHEAA